MGRLSLLTSAAADWEACSCAGAAAAPPKSEGVVVAGTSAPAPNPPNAGVDAGVEASCAPNRLGVEAAPNREGVDVVAPKAEEVAAGVAVAPKRPPLLAAAPKAGVLTAPKPGVEAAAGAELNEKAGVEAGVPKLNAIAALAAQK